MSPDGKEIVFSANIGLKDILEGTVLHPSHVIPALPFEEPGFDKNQQLLPFSAKADPDGNPEQRVSYLENNITDMARTN